jgi:hypothetical protein
MNDAALIKARTGAEVVTLGAGRLLVSLPEEIGTCCQKLAQCRAALDFGVDPPPWTGSGQSAARSLSLPLPGLYEAVCVYGHLLGPGVAGQHLAVRTARPGQRKRQRRRDWRCRLPDRTPSR